jgi:hypothetical protein
VSDNVEKRFKTGDDDDDDIYSKKEDLNFTHYKNEPNYYIKTINTPRIQ